MRKILSAIITLLFMTASAIAADTSVAGLYPVANSGRIIYNFNQGWRFMLGDKAGAGAKDFDDKDWAVVSVPHTLRLEPAEASGGRNYQGIAWYRKHFTMPADMKGKDVTLHFEAIMGKQEIYVNGKLACSHLGGYQPITVNLSKEGVKPGDKCVIAITDAIEADKVAGGGVFLHYDNITEKSAQAFVNVEVGNNSAKTVRPTVIVTIKEKGGKIIKTLKKSISIAPGKDATAMLGTTIKQPHLWSPESPYL